LKTPTSAEARRVAEGLLGRKVDRLEQFFPQTGGFDSHGFRLWAGDDAMLLKIMRRAGVPVGVYFHGRLREAGIPVPELRAFGADAGPEGQACAVWEWVEGLPVNWPKREPCPFDEGEFGELLRRIHELRFEGPFGFLGDDIAARSYSWSPYLRVTSDTWAGFFDFESAARWLRENEYLSAREAEVFASLPDRLAGPLSQAENRLLHTDLRTNLILDPDTRRIRAVVDYTESCAGDPRWELAYVDYRYTDRLAHYLPFDMARFRAAYGTDHNPRDELGRFYLAAILAFDEVPNADPASVKGRWAVSTLRSVVDSFDRQV
jgi:aminoglycoside phosphotransferase (APT) family kinase protein